MWYRFEKGNPIGIPRVKEYLIAFYDMTKNGECFDESHCPPDEIAKVIPFVETVEDIHNNDRSKVFVLFDNDDVYELKLEKVNTNKNTNKEDDDSEYTILDNIKNLITDDFLKEFRSQLFRIHNNYGLDTFAENGIPMNTSTGGWVAALYKACMLTHKEELFDYWRTLPWYDSDIFDGELAEMLVKKRFILGNLDKVIEQQLGIKLDDLRYCNDCGKLYSKDMVVKIGDNENNSIYISDYRCLHCQDIVDGNEYYKDILRELDDYKKEHPIDINDKI